MTTMRGRGREVLVYFGFLPEVEDMFAPEASSRALLAGAIVAGTIFGLLTWLLDDKSTTGTIVSGVVFGLAMFAVTLWTRSRSQAEQRDQTSE